MARYRTNSSLAGMGENYASFHFDRPDCGTYIYEDSHVPFFNTAEMTDELHPGFLAHQGGDQGGMVVLKKTTYTNVEPAKFDDVSRGFNAYWNPVGAWEWLPGIQTHHARAYPGALYPNTTQGESSPVRHSDNTLIGMGTTAIARTLPTNPSFGLSRSLGELKKDGVPAMVGMQTLKEKSKYLKNSGNEYLNVEFGWLPLISDLLGFARAVKNSNKTIKQFRKNSDKRIKRRYSYPSSSSISVSSGIAVVIGNFVPNRNWDGTLSTETSYDVHFSGAYRYHVPVGDDLSSQFALWESEANKLLGLRLTPKLVWDLAPWSWAVDWFSNTGDVLRNISALGTDGLVMEYGYITDVWKSVDTASASIDYAGKHYQCSTACETKYLRRFGASPFGFGFDMSTLSPTQDAVLVALGLSHGLR